jgi:hypothetical protein
MILLKLPPLQDFALQQIEPFQAYSSVLSVAHMFICLRFVCQVPVNITSGPLHSWYQ